MQKPKQCQNQDIIRETKVREHKKLILGLNKEDTQTRSDVTQDTWAQSGNTAMTGHRRRLKRDKIALI